MKALGWILLCTWTDVYLFIEADRMAFWDYYYYTHYYMRYRLGKD